MINSLLVVGTAMAFEEILKEHDVPHELVDDDESREFHKIWESADDKDRKLVFRQALPAVRRIAEHEPYLFETAGDPLRIRFNYLERKLHVDSFGELLLERPDINWNISVSIKNDARIISALPVADRARNIKDGRVINIFNEIDDFGERIFDVPCTNEYFNDVNEVLLTFEPLTNEEWMQKIKEPEFLYGKLISPMLRAIGNEVSRIMKYHPEAPQKMIDYFYGKYDYYFLNPIAELEVTRMGAVNCHGQLGRIPNSHHYYTTKVKYPTELLEVRFATGRRGEILKDTIKFAFDGGWELCMTLSFDEEHIEERNFSLNVYLPTTPYNSYRDQVNWDK